MSHQDRVADEDISRLLWEERETERDEPETSAADDVSETDSDNVEEGSETESEQSAEDDENDNEDDTDDSQLPGPSQPKRKSCARGKNGHVWSLICPSRRGRPSYTAIKTHLPTPKDRAKNVKTPLEAWQLLVSDDIIDKITMYTNEEINRKAANYTTSNFNIRPTDKIEIKSLFGLYYIAGVFKASKVNIEELWSIEFGNSLFRASMSLPRFAFLSSCLRFDDKNTRDVRKASDKFAAFREVWDLFINNCRTFYSPSACCTIDEQLVGTRTRCGFRMYLPNKPDKYGIKIVMMNDARTFYMCNAIPYTGLVNKPQNQSVPQYYVEKLSEDIWGTNRNITTDNWFTSVPLVEVMLKEHNLTMVGTLRKNKSEIPKEFLGKRSPNSCVFGFDGQKTLVSYSPKANKNVILISTMHHNDKIEEDGKPTIIHTYNQTKGGTDSFDQLCHTYTTARRTARWTQRMWFAVQDQAAVNAYVLLYLATSSENVTKLNRRSFLKELGFLLIKEHMERRVKSPVVPRNLRGMICDILKIEEADILVPIPSTLDAPKAQRCYVCPREKDRKTKIRCNKCHKAICIDHVIKSCYSCYYETHLIDENAPL